MAFYLVDMRERVIQRVTEKCGKYVGADNARYFLVQAGSKKMAWALAIRANDPAAYAQCDSCGHRFCPLCEECSLSQRYSDYWICHGCGAL